MKRSVTFVFWLVLMLSLVACSCNSTNLPSISFSGIITSSDSNNSVITSDNGEYGNDEDEDYVDYIHYLLFEADGVEIARIMTTPEDKYDDLQPYFPKVPEKEGYYNGKWEKLDEVYLEDQLIVTIVAYYTKIR